MTWGDTAREARRSYFGGATKTDTRGTIDLEKTVASREWRKRRETWLLGREPSRAFVRFCGCWCPWRSVGRILPLLASPAASWSAQRWKAPWLKFVAMQQKDCFDVIHQGRPIGDRGWLLDFLQARFPLFVSSPQCNAFPVDRSGGVGDGLPR